MLTQAAKLLVEELRICQYIVKLVQSYYQYPLQNQFLPYLFLLKKSLRTSLRLLFHSFACQQYRGLRDGVPYLYYLC